MCEQSGPPRQVDARIGPNERRELYREVPGETVLTCCLEWSGNADAISCSTPTSSRIGSRVQSAIL